MYIQFQSTHSRAQPTIVLSGMLSDAMHSPDSTNTSGHYQSLKMCTVSYFVLPSHCKLLSFKPQKTSILFNIVILMSCVTITTWKRYFQLQILMTWIKSYIIHFKNFYHVPHWVFSALRMLIINIQQPIKSCHLVFPS